MNSVRRNLCIGYTFIFKGQHCTITSLHPTYFTYTVSDTMPENFGNNYMYYDFFKTTNHYKSKFKVGVSK